MNTEILVFTICSSLFYIFMVFEFYRLNYKSLLTIAFFAIFFLFYISLVLNSTYILDENTHISWRYLITSLSYLFISPLPILMEVIAEKRYTSTYGIYKFMFVYYMACFIYFMILFIKNFPTASSLTQNLN